MIISDDRTIQSIQTEFQTHFPNLKIEFYTVPHDTEKGSSLTQQLLEVTKTIGELREQQNTGDLSINGHQKVSTLESNFRDIYGLNVQVFRRSGNDVWLQTSATDNWTLSEQNKRAERYQNIA